MLSEADLVALLGIFNDDNHSLETLVNNFGRTFAKTEHFRCGWSLSLPLLHAKLSRLVFLFFSGSDAA